ncbi:MAG TPA: hypothetical protein VL524_00885 [Gemmatimonadaceae bacterium]|jgi:hypothetical protein|nr:hypothetical protein [Gemmatimonadaceae bacterium]
MRQISTMSVLAAGAMLALRVAGAQTPANDPSARLREVLPSDVATRVLEKIAEARAHDLPAQALENRALKFAAKGVDPKDIEQSIDQQLNRMEVARDSLRSARGKQPSGDEVDAAADAMRKGLDGSQISALAKSAPSGRSLVVPLYVLGSLLDRGLPSDAALQKVKDRLAARASDTDLEQLPAQAGKGQRPAETGQALAETKRPGSAPGAANGSSAGGPPAGVPANGGRGANPGTSHKPTTPGGKKP